MTDTTDTVQDPQDILIARDEILSIVADGQSINSLKPDLLEHLAIRARGLGRVSLDLLRADADSQPEPPRSWRVSPENRWRTGIEHAGENQPKYLALEAIYGKHIWGERAGEVHLTLARGFYDLAMEEKNDRFFARASSSASNAVFHFKRSGQTADVIQLLSEDFAIGRVRGDALVAILELDDYEQVKSDSDPSIAQIVSELVDYYSDTDNSISQFDEFVHVCLEKKLINHEILYRIVLARASRLDLPRVVLADAVEKSSPMVLDDEFIVPEIAGARSSEIVEKYLNFLRARYDSATDAEKQSEPFYEQALRVLEEIYIDQNSDFDILKYAQKRSNWTNVFEFSENTERVLAEIVRSGNKQALDRFRKIISDGTFKKIGGPDFLETRIFSHYVDIGNLDDAVNLLQFAIKAGREREDLLTRYASLAVKKSRLDLIDNLLALKLTKSIREKLMAIKLESTPAHELDSMLNDEQLSVALRMTAYVSILEQNPETKLSEAKTLELMNTYLEAEKPDLAVIERLCQEAYKRNNYAIVSEAFKRLRSQAFQDTILLLTKYEKPSWYSQLLELMPKDAQDRFAKILKDFGI